MVLLGIMAIGAFAQGFSVSAGVGLQYDLGISQVEGADGFDMMISGYGFLDITYIELSVAYGYGINTENIEAGSMGLQVALLGKYPVYLGVITIFPLLGARYVLPDFDAMELAYPGLQAGAGLDILFGRNVFLRTEVLCDLDLKGFGDFYKDADFIQSFGPTAKIGLGYRF